VVSTVYSIHLTFSLP